MISGSDYVGDFGNAGPDKGKGGKYLFLPPDYKGDVPEGYFVLHSTTYGNIFFSRGFVVNGSTRNRGRELPRNLRGPTRCRRLESASSQVRELVRQGVQHHRQ